MCYRNRVAQTEPTSPSGGFGHCLWAKVSSKVYLTLREVGLPQMQSHAPFVPRAETPSTEPLRAGRFWKTVDIGLPPPQQR